MPCVTMSCETVWEKELIAKEMHMINKPTIGIHRAQRAKRRHVPIIRGAVKYMIPIEHVPMTAMLDDPAKGSWLL